MSRIVKCAHIQAANAKHDGTPAEIKEAMRPESEITLAQPATERGRWHSRTRGTPEFMGELPSATDEPLGSSSSRTAAKKACSARKKAKL